MTPLTLVVNGKEHAVSVPGKTPLLWVLRDALGLSGTKFGCGMGLCGACTVHLDGKAVRACLTDVDTVGARAVTTIEGLSADRSHPLQQAWLAEDVSQCGYCQPGQLMPARRKAEKREERRRSGRSGPGSRLRPRPRTSAPGSHPAG